MHVALGRLGELDRGREQRELVREEQADAAVGGTERTGADPHDLAGRAHGVEVALPVPADAQREHV